MADPNAHSIRKRIRVSIHTIKAKLTTCFNPEQPSDMKFKISSPIAGTFRHQYHLLHTIYYPNAVSLHPQLSNTNTNDSNIEEEGPLPIPRSLSLPTTHPSTSTLLTNQTHTIQALRASLLASQTQTTTLKNQIELLNLQISRSEELATNNAALQREIYDLKKALGTSKRSFLRTMQMLNELADKYKEQKQTEARAVDRLTKQLREEQDYTMAFQLFAKGWMS